MLLYYVILIGQEDQSNFEIERATGHRKKWGGAIFQTAWHHAGQQDMNVLSLNSVGRDRVRDCHEFGRRWPYISIAATRTHSRAGDRRGTVWTRNSCDSCVQFTSLAHISVPYITRSDQLLRHHSHG